MSDSLWLHGLQHARHPCPSPSPIVCSNSCPLSQLCHPTISSSGLFTLLLLPSIFPSIRVFSNESTLHIRWPNYWSFSFSISPSNEYSGLISFRVDWFDLLLSKGLSRVFSSTTVQKQQFFGAQPSLWPTSHICAWQEKYQSPQICRWHQAEHWRIDAFELWCWRNLLRVPWTARRSNQSTLKEISPEYSLESLMLKLKLQYFDHLMQRTDSLENPWCWERLKAGGEGDDRGWGGWMT